MIKSKKKYVLVIVPVVFIAVFIASLGVWIAMFNQKVEKEVKRLFTNTKDMSGMRYSTNQTNNLPDPVQRYFMYSFCKLFYFVKTIYNSFKVILVIHF